MRGKKGQVSETATWIIAFAIIALVMILFFISAVFLPIGEKEVSREKLAADNFISAKIFPAFMKSKIGDIMLATYQAWEEPRMGQSEINIKTHGGMLTEDYLKIAKLEDIEYISAQMFRRVYLISVADGSLLQVSNPILEKCQDEEECYIGFDDAWDFSYNIIPKLDESSYFLISDTGRSKKVYLFTLNEDKTITPKIELKR